MVKEEKQRRWAFRVDEATFQVLEELKGLNVNVSELGREMADAALPGLQGMVRAIRAEREGRLLDAKREVQRMAAELVEKVIT